MRKQFSLWKITLLIILLCTANSLSASTLEVEQEFVVKGRVIDDTKEGIPGTNVSVKGTSIGVITDIDGNYEIRVPNKKSVLIFSFIGFQTQEILIGSKTVLDVTLVDDSKLLDEVVVVAYGTKSKATITGAMATMDTKE